jgi:signal transduction histidine kinase
VAAQVPLMYAGTSVGSLVVAPRDPDTPLSSADQRLLAEVARPLGVAAHAAALQARLEQSRLRLVTERGEARRRLGGDLHDLIGHQVVGVAHQVERAAHLLGDDHPRARALLAEITQRLHGVTGQVRGLAHELFPPELALLGLEGAIRERALAYSHLPIQVVAAEPLPPLPAEVEAAIYAITLEALTNVDKHARASRCTLSLQTVAEARGQGAQQLAVTISDDGVGFPDARATGMGVLSMQARAAEIGGVCEVTSQLGKGTSVTIRIPYCSGKEGGAQ